MGKPLPTCPHPTHVGPTWASRQGRDTTGRQGVWGREEGPHRPSDVQGAGGGTPQAVRGSGDRRRAHTGRQMFRGREEGHHRPSDVQGAGGGTPQAVRGSGDGRRGTTGRQGEKRRGKQGAMGCSNDIYIFIKDDVKLSMHLKLKGMPTRSILS